MILRLVHPQGWAGLAASVALLGLLLIQKVETRHWRKQSAQYERLYRAEQSASATTIANYRAAADAARKEDQANAARVAAEQRAINERTAHDFEARLADARARFMRLQLQSRPTAAADGSGRAAPVPAAGPAAGAPGDAAAKDRLSDDDRLTATEQAIQLDELIKWVRAQASVAH